MHYFLNYTLLELIGEGGMAKVYLATHNTLGHQLAIKVLNKDYVFNSNIRSRFIEEAKKMVRMNHPNVVKVTDLIDDENTVAIVMEYVQGKTLKQILEDKKLNDKEIEIYFKQMVNALEYVHSQGLIHRDVKPSNFILSNDGHLKLTDFGISKSLDTESVENTQTGTTVSLGTPMYMSPEQVRSTKDVTKLTDIYSLGVVLWEMVSGQKPYGGNTLSAFDLQLKIVQDKLPLTSTKWDEIIQKATEKEELKRKLILDIKLNDIDLKKPFLDTDLSQKTNYEFKNDSIINSVSENPTKNIKKKKRSFLSKILISLLIILSSFLWYYETHIFDFENHNVLSNGYYVYNRSNMKLITRFTTFLQSFQSYPEISIESGNTFKVGLADENGSIITPEIYNYIDNLGYNDSWKTKSDKVLVTTKGKNRNHYGLINFWGQEILPNNFGVIEYLGVIKSIKDYENIEYYKIGKEKKNGVYTENGTFVIPKKYGICTEKGTFVLPVKYDLIEDFSSLDGYLIKLKNKYGIIRCIYKKYDAEVLFLKGIKYDSIIDFSKYESRKMDMSFSNSTTDFFGVKTSNKWSLLNNKTLKQIYPFIFDDIQFLKQENEIDIYKYIINGKWGVMDGSGNIIVEPKFDSLKSDSIFDNHQLKYGYVGVFNGDKVFIESFLN